MACLRADDLNQLAAPFASRVRVGWEWKGAVTVKRSDLVGLTKTNCLVWRA